MLAGTPTDPYGLDAGIVSLAEVQEAQYSRSRQHHRTD